MLKAFADDRDKRFCDSRDHLVAVLTLNSGFLSSMLLKSEQLFTSHVFQTEFKSVLIDECMRPVPDTKIITT